MKMCLRQQEFRQYLPSPAKIVRLVFRGFAPIFLLLSLSFSVWAIDLDEAKNSGLVGELNNGYLGYVVAAPSADTRALVEDINAKRKQFYQQTAAKTGATLEQVAATAYQKAVAKTDAGNYYQNSAGQWVKK